MSDPNYARYGVDDDPFLTHPAGVGRAPVRADSRYGQPNLAAERGGGAVPSRLPPAPQPSYHSVEDAPHHGQFAPAAHGAHGQWAEHSSYNQPQHYAPQVQGYHQPHSAPQQGNFRARDDYAARFEDQAYAPPQPSYDPDYAPAAAPRYAARPEPRPEPRLSAPPRVYAPAQPASAHRHSTAGHAAASFAASPRVAAQPAAQRVDANGGGYGYHTAQHPQRDYAPLPTEAQFAGYEESGFTLGLMPSSAKIMQWAGALCTVLAVIGVVYWGYSLAVRDAHGIPVVRAQVDPLRLAPDTPGGEISSNQGLAVNAIPAAAAPTIPDQITLAPQEASLAPEDTQIIENGSFAQTAGAGSAEALAGASDKVMAVPETTGGISADLTALPDALPEDMPLTDAEAVERALAAALAEGGDPLPEESDAAAMSAQVMAQAEPASMSATDPIAPPTSELDPASIAVGTPLAQLGAFDTPETARAEWANLQTRFTELMAGKALVVEPAKSGGRDFFRLRAHGFDSADDTRRFCAAILAENGSCFPVDQR